MRHHRAADAFQIKLAEKLDRYRLNDSQHNLRSNEDLTWLGRN